MFDETEQEHKAGNDAGERPLAEIILETINSMVLVANGNSEILYASPSVKAILGYAPEQLLGMQYWNTPTPDPELREQHRQKVAAIARGEMSVQPAPYAVKMLTRSGEERWVLWRDARAHGGLVVGAGQDITELRQTQEELRRREEEVRAVFERATDGMLVVDQQLCYVDANPAACEMFGLEKVQILGRHVGSITSSNTGLERLRMQLESTGEALEEVEYRPVSGPKKIFECRITANIRPGFHLVIIRDISVRKLLEQQLAESQRLEAVGRLAGGVAHEFNNMLTAIVGYAELIVKNSPQESLTGNYAQGIVTAANRAAQTTQQLLAFSRRQVIQPRVLQVNQVIRETAELLQRMLGEEIEIVLRLNEECGPVRLDPNQLTQILINLGLNARDSMPRAGKLIIETSPAQLDHTYVSKHVQVKPGSYVLLAVSDTGIGIAPEAQAHIFEPFFTTKEQGDGAGLGLATVYGIVRQNDGRIWVYSEPGAGTTFKIYLPTSKDSHQDRLAQPPANMAGATVLVIEDDVATRQMIASALREQGFRVLQAEDGGEALLACEEYDGALDLVITDLGASAMSGEDLRAYFALKHPNSRLLHMSGYSGEKLQITSELPPNIQFLQKPFTVGELVEKVIKALSKR